jgi:sugar lactone lactonase YvrE
MACKVQHTTDVVTGTGTRGSGTVHRQLFIAAVIGLCAVIFASPASGAIEGSLVRHSNTNWSTPSTDPTGLTYDGKRKKLLISDSEVDETQFWKGRNLFLATKAGALKATRRLTKATVEPEGISWYPRGKSLFVVDDDKNAIFRFGPGRDGKIGTRDDKVKKVVDTLRYGSGDGEGVTWHARRGKVDMLIWTDATTTKVYELKRGRDHRFGTKDDVMKRAFAASQFADPNDHHLNDPNGIYFDGKTGHLFVVDSKKHFLLETTLTGGFVRTIEMPFCRAKNPTTPCRGFSDLVFAPGTDGSPHHLYLTDRGVDNNVDPNENDGKLYEVELVDVP